MKRIIFAFLMLVLLAVPASALEFTAPEAPDDVTDLLPVEKESFGEGLWKVVTSAIGALQPNLADAARVCLSVVAVVVLTSVLRQLPGGSVHTVELVGCLAVATILLSTTNSMIRLGVETVERLSDYGKLLLPVMTAAMAAQGGVTSSAALYVGTAVFDAILSEAVSKLIVPMVYMYLVLSVAASVVNESMLVKIKDFVKGLLSWGLKIILYIFTGYMSITGAVSGTADAATIKAAKLTISGMVPVVGSILSDASESVIVGVGVMKSGAGIYGLLAILAIWISPFLQIGIQYLLLKLTAAVCDVFEVKQLSALIHGFSTAMGLLLAMTGAVCFMLLISIVCFMKGVG